MVSKPNKSPECRCEGIGAAVGLLLDTSPPSRPKKSTGATLLVPPPVCPSIWSSRAGCCRGAKRGQPHTCFGLPKTGRRLTNHLDHCWWIGSGAASRGCSINITPTTRRNTSKKSHGHLFFFTKFTLGHPCITTRVVVLSKRRPSRNSVKRQQEICRLEKKFLTWEGTLPASTRGTATKGCCAWLWACGSPTAACLGAGDGTSVAPCRLHTCSR